MQVEIVRKQPGGDWNSFGIFARQLIQVMTSRIQMDHRQSAIERSVLVERGLYSEIIDRKVDEATGKVTIGRKYKPKDDTEETALAITEERKKIYEMEVYQLMHKDYLIFKHFEDEMRKQAVELVKDYEITKFCEGVKGLGYMSALTFLSYFNPLRTKSPSNWMSMLGWTEGSKLKRGEQGHSNPLAKGRTYKCCLGVIMANNPYYYPLFKIKKEYLAMRPDMVFKTEQKKKGVKAHINALGMDFIVKLVLNHAFELLYLDYWGINYYQSEEYSRVRHRNHIPRPDTITPEEWTIVHDISKRVNDKIIVDAWQEWDKDPGIEWKKDSPNDKAQYREWLKHIPIEIYLQGEKIPG